ncbi:TPA: phage recombination protein Bet [Pasteurella multocida]|uniref:Phage recombination protein Bet n=1 Tax=Pasteurella multocida TaxID=747 RepID=A0AAW8VAN8_PASMD|nr:phage recombination protein Bet [Pasteurella multocida]ANJ89296.1 phage recombination protein Bet [Pasteurella multocida subsp. multocida HB01]ANJ90548.1 phage recombination protein Bet [Pasteurella multocida subsp. multocida HB01]AON58480.1 recombinase [Pasteurella multocida]AUK27479.1 phage recombination protein Bet [Pasteurella multocida]AUK28676.1 phage recombination protein Bet [Pasteurella multocida]
MTANLPENIQTALTDRKIDTATWTTLQNSVFPGAKDESILLAIDYCKARKLDILKKPCHIVPMSVKDAKTGQSQWRDVIMPGIYEQRITAFRTGQMAGQDEPIFGETISHLGIEAPEWCKVTVYRFIGGERCAFSHTEYFSEACSTTKDGRINSMWTKRPRGQLAKCAEAGALRKAFPDELGGVITADEVIEEQAPQAEQHKTTVIDTVGIELATPEQVHQLQQLIQLTNTNTLKAFAYYGVNTLEQLPKEKAEHFIRTLNQRLDEQSANVTENYVDEEIPLD